MPAIKFKPSKHAKRRDFWGDAQRGQLFLELVEEKFGNHFGARKDALSTLGLQRRLFNMYVTGERSIPDDVWAKLRKTAKRQRPKPKRANTTCLYIDDIDPLS